MELARNHVGTVRDAKGALLRVTRGIVWITQESDPEDTVLRAGDNWVLERDGLTVIQAHVDATFCLEGATIFEQTPISPAKTLRARARCSSTTWKSRLPGVGFPPSERSPRPPAARGFSTDC